MLLSEEDMENNIGELTISFNTSMSEQENGRLFMGFKKNNDHVNSRVFRLSNDVKGIYYLTDFGQLIIASYTLHEIRYLENQLKASPLAPFLICLLYTSRSAASPHRIRSLHLLPHQDLSLIHI